MRLSIKEAHVYIQQELQRQGAFKKDIQFKQATDFALNTAMSKFIRGRVKASPNATHRFEVDEPSRNDLQQLIQLNKELVVFKEGDYYISQLPNNFKYLLNDASIVLEDCNTTSFKDPSTTVTERVTIVPFINSGLSAAPYYKSIIIGNTAKTYTITTPGFFSVDEKFTLVDLVLNAFTTGLQVECYWERYKELYYPNCFLAVYYSAANAITMGIDDAVSPTHKFVDSQVVQMKTNLTGASDIVPNRNLKNDFVRSALQSNYQQPFPDSPVSTIYKNRLIVYTTKRFLVSRIFIDYVRLPMPVNISLDQGFELHEDTHDRICDLAVEIMKKRIEDPSLATTMQHNAARGEEN